MEDVELNYEELKEKTEKLLGAEELKAYVADYRDTFSALYTNEYFSLRKRAVLLSIADGDGYKTWVKTLRDLWNICFRPGELPIGYYSLRIPDIVEAEGPQLTSDRDLLLHVLDNDGILTAPSYPRVLCIDITKWMDRIEGPEMRAVFARLRETVKDQFLIFRVPAMDAVNVERMKDTIGWFLNVDDLCCQPFSLEEYTEYGVRCFSDMGLDLGEGVREHLSEIIAYERRSRYFCGFETVKRIVDEVTFDMLRNRYGYVETEETA
ncbi:MAG: hypothetical protein K5891_00800 [Lachnospiraceae bacterium]|nr:hypothetical protein [Lachnospiraceae bacterium]